MDLISNDQPDLKLPIGSDVTNLWTVTNWLSKQYSHPKLDWSPDSRRSVMKKISSRQFGRRSIDSKSPSVSSRFLNRKKLIAATDANHNKRTNNTCHFQDLCSEDRAKLSQLVIELARAEEALNRNHHHDGNNNALSTITSTTPLAKYNIHEEKLTVSNEQFLRLENELHSLRSEIDRNNSVKDADPNDVKCFQLPSKITTSPKWSTKKSQLPPTKTNHKPFSAFAPAVDLEKNSPDREKQELNCSNLPLIDKLLEDRQMLRRQRQVLQMVAKHQQRLKRLDLKLDRLADEVFRPDTFPSSTDSAPIGIACRHDANPLDPEQQHQTPTQSEWNGRVHKQAPCDSRITPYNRQNKPPTRSSSNCANSEVLEAHHSIPPNSHPYPLPAEQEISVFSSFSLVPRVLNQVTNPESVLCEQGVRNERGQVVTSKADSLESSSRKTQVGTQTEFIPITLFNSTKDGNPTTKENKLVIAEDSESTCQYDGRSTPVVHSNMIQQNTSMPLNASSDEIQQLLDLLEGDDDFLSGSRIHTRHPSSSLRFHQQWEHHHPSHHISSPSLFEEERRMLEDLFFLNNKK